MNIYAFREGCRKNTFSFISGWFHFWLVVGGSILVSIISLFFINNIFYLEFLIVPISIIIANFVEYFFHRWPMHRVIPFMKKMYKTHSGKHHRYFTNDYMNMESDKDFHEVFATPATVSAFLFGIVLPLSFVFSLISINIAILFFATTMFYYGFYEFIHFSTHLSPNHFISKLPFMKGARERHQTHHNTRLMREWNFNIGFPLMDFLFRTLKK